MELSGQVHQTRVSRVNICGNFDFAPKYSFCIFKNFWYIWQPGNDANTAIQYTKNTTEGKPIKTKATNWEPFICICENWQGIS